MSENNQKGVKLDLPSDYGDRARTFFDGLVSRYIGLLVGLFQYHPDNDKLYVLFKQHETDFENEKVTSAMFADLSREFADSDEVQLATHPKGTAMFEVDSSNVRSIGWDALRRVLYVRFLDDEGTYLYFDVPPARWDEFNNAESKGSFLHEKIKGEYEYTKVEHGREDDEDDTE